MSDKPSNIVSLPGMTAPCLDQYAPPNDALVSCLEDMLSMAKEGTLQSLIGTGFSRDGMRVSIWSDFHEDVYQMLGSLAWLQAEYVRRHEGRDE